MVAGVAGRISGPPLHPPNSGEPVSELGDDAEVAAATADRPEQIRLMLMINRVHSTVSSDDLGGEDIVDGHPVSTAQEADPATKRELADANAPDVAEPNREPMRLERPGHLSGCETGLEPSTSEPKASTRSS
jgi:hypothetical protein